MSGGEIGTDEGLQKVYPPFWYQPVKASILTNGSAPPWVFAGETDPDPQEWAEYVLLTVEVEAEVIEAKRPKTQTRPRGTMGRSNQTSARSTTFHINRGKGPVMVTEG